MWIERSRGGLTAAAALAGLSLAIAGCGGSSPSTTRTATGAAPGSATTTTSSSPATSTSGSAAVETLRVELQAPPGEPKAGQLWPVTVRARTAAGAPVDGTVSYAFLFGGAVVSHQPGGQMRNGVYHDRLKFPAQALGYPLTLRVEVAGSAGSGSTTRPVKVER